MTQPRYTHDKDCCELIGTYKEGDLYACEHFYGAYALRYGDAPNEYYVGPFPVLVELWTLNQEKTHAEL